MLVLKILWLHPNCIPLRRNLKRALIKAMQLTNKLVGTFSRLQTKSKKGEGEREREREGVKEESGQLNGLCFSPSFRPSSRVVGRFDMWSLPQQPTFINKFFSTSSLQLLYYCGFLLSLQLEQRHNA